MIEFKNVSFSYLSTDNKKIDVLDNMNFKIEDGSFVAIAGENGSGKSTAAKLMNVLLTLRLREAFLSTDLKLLKKKISPKSDELKDLFFKIQTPSF